MPDKDEEIVVYTDERGLKVSLSRPQYREKVIRPNLQNTWNDPNALKDLAVGLLRDDFPEEANEAADRLTKLLGETEDCLVLKSAALIGLDRLGEASETLNACLTKFPGSGAALTNVAMIEEARGNQEKARETLLKALRLDPNQEYALRWLTRYARDDQGRHEVLEILRTLAALPGAWRPQLHLAGMLLDLKEVDLALKQYNEAVSRAEEHKDDMVLAAAAELDRCGCHEEAASFCVKYWSSTSPNPQVGLALAEAYGKAGRADQALNVLKKMEPHVAAAYRDLLGRKQAELGGNAVPH